MFNSSGYAYRLTKTRRVAEELVCAWKSLSITVMTVGNCILPIMNCSVGIYSIGLYS